MENSIEIARGELPSSTSVSIHAYINPDGSLRFFGNDYGNLVEKVWGDDDYEYWVDVPASEIGRLLLLLLKEKFGGNLQAVDQSRTFARITLLLIALTVMHKYFAFVVLENDCCSLRSLRVKKSRLDRSQAIPKMITRTRRIVRADVARRACPS